jgi:hypothetical protein
MVSTAAVSLILRLTSARCRTIFAETLAKEDDAVKRAESAPGVRPTGALIQPALLPVHLAIRLTGHRHFREKV